MSEQYAVAEGQRSPRDVDGTAAASTPGGTPVFEAERGRYLVFAIVSLGLLMVSVDQTIVATALPAIQSDLNAPINWVSWTITIYALGQILVMPLAGRLGEQFGRKRIFLGAVILFTVASLCCGLVNNIYALVALRGLQAVGGGAFLPSATGIVSQQFGPNRDRALGLFASVFPIGAIIGPVLGGILVTYLSWRWIFFVNVPIGIVLIGMGAIFIPRSSGPSRGHLDFVGIALLGTTLLPAMLGIAYLGNGSSSLTSPRFLLPEAVAALSLAFFLRHSFRGSAPFIPARLLVGRGFGVMNGLNFLFGAMAVGFGSLVPLYAENRYGISSLHAGTLLTARAIGMIATAALAVSLLRRTGYRLPMIVGFSLIIVGLVGLAVTPEQFSAYTWLALAAGTTGVGMGMSTPASNNAVMSLAPDNAAAIAGLRGMFRQTGGITAISVTTAILARSSNPGVVQAHIYAIFAVVLACSLPLVLLVPDQKGGW